MVLTAVHGERHKTQVDSAEKEEEVPNRPWQTPPLPGYKVLANSKMGRSSLIADEKEPDPFANTPLGTGYSKPGDWTVLRTPERDPKKKSLKWEK